MLMEGYDHKYLTILAIFRPYKSLNAFAQIVGRVLRAIPEKEIVNHDIDNNALIIYHEGLGLNTLWEYFKKETQKSKMRVYNGIDNDPISREEYERREQLLAEVTTEKLEVAEELSFLDDTDYNAKFEQARLEIQDELDKVKDKLKNAGATEEEINLVLEKRASSLRNKKTREIDSLLIRANPELARQEYRQLLKDSVQDNVAEILISRGIDEKGNELYDKFKGHLYGISPTMQNDGILVNYVNLVLAKRFDPIKTRSLEQFKLSIDALDSIFEKLGKML
jgi:superfamily II DNA or RNA helicase